MASYNHETMCWGYFGPISSNSVDHRNWIGKVIEQYSCLVPFLSERLCYRAPVTSTEWVGRPSFVITKEQLEVMRSYGLSWVEIARALGKPKINFIVKKNVHAESFVFFFCHAPFFENGFVLFSFDSYFKKVLDVDTAAWFKLNYVSHSPLPSYKGCLILFYL